MSQRWRQLILSFLASSVLFVACKKEYSPDETLPTSYSPNVIISSNNQVVFALNPTSGQKSWELGLPCPVLASPILYKGSVFIASSNRDTLYKINAKTGQLTRKVTYAGAGVGAKATPIADGNIIYVASMSGSLFAIDTSDYSTKWRFAADGPLEASPTIHNGNIYFASTLGTVYCLEKTNGTTAPLPASPTATWSLTIPGASFVSSPAVAAPYLFLGSLSDSNMYCIYLDAPDGGTTGLMRWSYKTKGGIKSSPAAYKGTCIFGANDFRLYCLDTTIDPFFGITVPEARWIDSLNSEVVSSPFPYDQTVYVGCKDYRVYALRMINGSAKWTFSSNGVITSSPLAYNGTVYVGSFDKHLYALDTARGTLKWKANINGQIECSPVIDDLTKLTGHNSQISGYTN